MSYLIRSFYPPALRILLKMIRKRPHRVIKGFGVRSQIGRYCREHDYDRVLIVTGSKHRKLGLLDQITESLGENNIQYSVYDEIMPNPTFSMIEKGVTVGLKQDVKCIIAVGGGSVMDAAKVISGGITCPGAGARHMATSWTTILNSALPMISVPTTAGTGAEITLGAVISDDETHVKYTGICLYLNVVLVVLDGELTMNCPPALTASAGFDALSHGIEGYLSGRKLKGSERLNSLQCVQLAMKYLPIAYRDGQNREARMAMARAAYLGGLAINLETLGYAHSLGHSIGAKYDIPHGESIAMTLPAVMRFQKKENEGALAELALACGIGKREDRAAALADQFIAAIETLIEELNLSRRCPQLRKEDYPALIANSCRDSKLWIVKKVMTYHDGERLLDEISGGILHVSENSRAAAPVSAVEKRIRLGALGVTAVYGAVKKNWLPFGAVAGFHLIEYLAEKRANRRNEKE